jgi:hypothetical protein
VTEQAMPAWYASPSLQTLAISDQEECLDNPCDPYCERFDEEPDVPIVSTEEGDGGSSTFDWEVGSLASYPGGLVKKGLVEPCQTGFDCQFNMRCESPDSGSCSHSVCSEGTALEDECSDCTTLVCAEDPSCCEDESSTEEHTCSHDPCVTGGRLKTSCSTCVATICESMPSCCAPGGGGGWTQACVDAVGDICGNSCGCDTDEIEYNDHCYYYEESNEDWYDAQDECEDRGQGWNLVAVNDQDENDFTEAWGDDNNRWIGFNDTNTWSREDEWVWTSGDPAGVWDEDSGGSLYENFASNEPNNWGADCARMNDEENGTWDGVDCDNDYDFICEGPGSVMKAAPSTNAWTGDCVAMAATVCDVSCDEDNPSSNSGSCVPWYPGETDADCAGIDLSVGVPCDGVIPICNHGQTEAPAGVAVVHLPGNSDQYPNCTADTTQANAANCVTTEPIPPGECISLSDTTCLDKQDMVAPLNGNRAIMVNPAGAIEECSCQDNWSLFSEGEGCGEPVCAGGSSAATQVTKPVDIIFIIDNSGSMNGEIKEVQTRINEDLAATLSASGLDYRVIMVSRFGDVDTSVGGSNNPICVGPPLGASDCSEAADGELQHNSPYFFHYSADIESEDAWCQLLYGYNHADEIDEQRSGWTDVASNGWGEWLRSDSFKSFVVITDDDVDCSDYGYDFDDDHDATNGTSTAAAFDTALLGLSSTHFGTLSARNYVWHSIIGMTEHPDGDRVPWQATEAIQTSECTPTNESEGSGTGYQALSILTGGLRYPICQNDNFDAIFSAIAEEVVESAAAACDFSLPDPETFSATGTVVAWTDSDEDNNPLTQVDDDDSCTDDGWYFDDQDTPTQVTLCPTACEDVQADAGAQLFVELKCPSTSSYETTSVSETYLAECSAGYQPQWNFFTYTAQAPQDTTISFRARTAATEAELADATWVDIATATSDAPSCELTDASEECPVVLYDVLGAASASLEYLELEATLNPTDSETPSLNDWQITFSCPPDE